MNGKIMLIAFACFLILLIPTVQAFTTISKSSVDFLSNDPTVRGKAWVLTVVQDGKSDYAVGNWVKSEIKDDVTGEQATHDFKIEIFGNKQECRYPIRNQYKYIGTAHLETRTYWLGFGADELDTWCAQNNDYSVAISLVGKKAWTWDYICVYFTKDAVYGSVGTPTLTFESKIKLSSDSDTREATITSTGQTNAWIGDKAHASWVGSLTTGEQCPIPSSQKIDAAYYNGAWRAIDSSNYQEYRTYNDVGMGLCKIDFERGEKTIERCVSDYNYKKDMALLSKSLVSEGGTRATTSGTLSNGQAFLPLSKVIQYPMLTLKIKAEWLGIYVPVGMPRIVSQDCSSFRTGSTGYVVIQVKNIGDATGDFVAYVECDPPFTMQGIRQSISLLPNQQGTLNIPITGVAAQPTNADCRIKIYDQGNPNNKDEKTVTCSVEPIVVCTPGQQRCVGKVVEQCSVSGSKWDRVRICDHECGMDPVTNKAVCVTVADRDGDGIPDDIDKCPDEAGILEYEGCRGPLAECGWWIPGILPDLGCHIVKFFEGLFKTIIEALMWIGIVVIIIVVIFIVLKLKGKSPREYIPYPFPPRRR